MRKITNFVMVAALLGICVSANGVLAAGELDTTFNASAYTVANTPASIIVRQPDGKMIIAGGFTVINGVARNRIARLNTDGTVDTTFEAPELGDPSGGNPGISILSIALQADGKILVGGTFGTFGTNYLHLMRLNTNGSIDTSFTNWGNSGQLTTTNRINKILVRPNGNILIGGFFTLESNGVATTSMARLLPNGQLDTTFDFTSFGGTVRDFVVFPDESFLVCDINIAKYSSTGVPDQTFPTVITNAAIVKMRLLPDGNILIAGAFNAVNFFTNSRIARITPNGSVDLSFNTNGLGAGPADFNTVIYDFDIGSDGKIYVAGNFSTFNSIARTDVARLNTNGTLDESFVPAASGANTIMTGIAVSDSNVTIVGNGTGTTGDAVYRLNMSGGLDSAYVVKAGKPSLVRRLAQMPNGKVVIGGSFPIVNGVARNGLAMLESDGKVDTTFVPFFNVGVAQNIYSLVPQADGKIIVGAFQGIGFKRLNADGSNDVTFITDIASVSQVYDVIRLAGGEFLLVGNNITTNGATIGLRKVVKVAANGVAIGAFGNPTIDGTVRRAIEQPDGKIIIAGEFTQIGTTIRGRIARLNSDGTLDTTFNPPGGANGIVADIALQPDGKIVAVGAFTSLNGSSTVSRVGRYLADGTLDTTFNQTADATINAVQLQSDGKLIIGGNMTTVGGVPHQGLARLNANGTLDGSFVATSNAQTLDVALQTDGKALVGGEFFKVNNVSRVCVARLLNAAAPIRKQFDFDGDGKADVAVYRPSTGYWYILRSSDFGVTQTQFAVPADVPAPADYDGDGKTDIAIYRGVSGNWWSISSINGQQINFQLGQLGDIPRPSDFDGDGRDDYVVFRPSTSQWFRASSANGAQSNKSFGLSGDKPLIADIDGDGKSDVAIYRPSDGNWWWQSSVDNVQRATKWGLAEDIPAPADYDADGKTDFAVFRPSTGVWYVLNSGGGNPLIGPFGLTGDKPVAADYDGDGKADLSVFRPSDTIWYLLRTTSGFTGFQFGVATDIPVESAFSN